MRSCVYVQIHKEPAKEHVLNKPELFTQRKAPGKEKPLLEQRGQGREERAAPSHRHMRVAPWGALSPFQARLASFSGLST